MYDRPYSKNEVIENSGMEKYLELSEDPAHKFRMDTGIELIHREPTKQELIRIYKNWLKMDKYKKRISDEKSIELFGMDNVSHFMILITEYK